MCNRFAKTVRVVFAVAILGSVVGCDTMSSFNPFREKEVPLKGERRPVPRVAPPPPDAVPQPLSALPDESLAKLA